jgi:hypothetical protein
VRCASPTSTASGTPTTTYQRGRPVDLRDGGRGCGASRRR